MRISDWSSDVCSSDLLHHERLEDALSYILAQKLGTDTLSALGLREVVEEAMDADPDIGNAVRADLVAVNERDPACRGFLKPLLFFKGFQSIQTHRVAHWLWNQNRETMGIGRASCRERVCQYG